MEHTQVQTLEDPNLYDFLVNAPKNFRESERIKKFQLRNGDYIHCVLWNYHFYITGTDIVKILIWRFQNAGRQIGAIKKFEEGIFSDLRNLKPGVDATLENPRSDFLEFLYKNGCIRTQKKQKVFFWFSVPHDALFFDALERTMRRDNSIYAQNSFGVMHRDGGLHGLGGGTRAACARQKSSFIQGSKSSAMPLQKNNSGFFETSDIGPIEPLRSADPYNIRESLFGYSRKPFEKKVEYASIEEPSASTPRTIPEASWLFQERPPEKQAVPASKKSPVEVLNEFDEFDFGQFGFLKERYMEQLGEAKDACKQKIFERERVDGGVQGRDSFGEVHFVENKTQRQVE